MSIHGFNDAKMINSMQREDSLSETALVRTIA